MNERIKELMLMAFQEHYGDPITPAAREKAVELVSGWGEKFAELIVAECADYVQFYYKDHMCEVIAHDMKQHFGVEE